MAYIAQAIAFSALIAGSVYLEITGHKANGLWIVVVLWVLFADWIPKKDNGQ